MPDIDPRKIKPGDTVRYQYRNTDMKAAGIVPKESAGQVYTMDLLGRHIPCVDGYPLQGSSDLTVLEHIPARPDWAGSLVVRNGPYCNVWVCVDRENAIYLHEGVRFEACEIEERYGPTTIVLDADGNPPEPEPEWLDADALDKLPRGTAVVCKMEPVPHVHLKGHGGWWWCRSNRPMDSKTFAPARVLWAPEGDR